QRLQDRGSRARPCRRADQYWPVACGFRPGDWIPSESAGVSMSVMFPAFLDLAGRKAVVIGGGPVAAAKIESLIAAGARVTVVAPNIRPEIEDADVEIDHGHARSGSDE